MVNNGLGETSLARQAAVHANLFCEAMLICPPTRCSYAARAEIEPKAKQGLFMDFMRLLKSLEELLYELVSWIVFYPLTLWRSVVHPHEMMRYADTELSDTESEQYTDALSPPLFLLISLLLVHGAELSLIREAMPWAKNSFFGNDSNLLMFRAVSFSIFPLLMALKLLRSRRAKVDRNTLKPPFYSQCYIAVPFALGVSLAMLLVRTGIPVLLTLGLILLSASLLWYIAVETRWFTEQLKLPAGRALLSVVLTIAQAIAFLTIVIAVAAYATGLVRH